jgi:hypothetical protein
LFHEVKNRDTFDSKELKKQFRKHIDSKVVSLLKEGTDDLSKVGIRYGLFGKGFVGKTETEVHKVLEEVIDELPPLTRRRLARAGFKFTVEDVRIFREAYNRPFVNGVE